MTGGADHKIGDTVVTTGSAISNGNIPVGTIGTVKNLGSEVLADIKNDDILIVHFNRFPGDHIYSKDNVKKPDDVIAGDRFRPDQVVICMQDGELYPFR